ncbi:hypothetical protein [Lentilitoribacter sp. EG35]|uniref:hypothetical protein n=1 Tax=Lentilitoribacter sp. EG35 TaxID=3234192 RepID=UPI0034609A85
MNYIEFSSKIDATPAVIWDILTDKDQLLAGNVGITRLEGDIRLGNKIKLWAEVGGDRAFPIKIIEMDMNKKMVWQGGMPLGLFTGTRQFNITQDGNGSIFHLREDYTGLLTNMIRKSMPDMNPSFEKFVLAIKRLAEAKAGETQS